MSEAPSLVDLIHRWAEGRPDRPAFRFLRSDETIYEEVTYAALRHRTQAIARVLTAQSLPAGSRALLLFDTEPGFVYAFFGCLAAAVVAVPADPPHGRRAWTGMARIIDDCRPALILTSRAIAQRWHEALTEAAATHACRVIAIEDALADGDTGAPFAAAPPGAIAFLQYTSGSTASPRGVMVTHANIMANVRMLEDAFALESDEQIVGWLPLFHDMGLIGFVLVPVYLGCTSTIMSPAAFLEKPVRWLRAISRYGGTISSGPNFAYDLCRAKIRPEDRETLDLARWRAALNGSEPVSARTMRQFEETFAPCGFRPDTFRPCCGMAEAPLLISAAGADGPVRLLPAARVGAESAEAAFRIESAEIVSCGRAAGGGALTIVDPVARRECRDGDAGEVWFRGTNVACGYWQNESATLETFAARLAGSDTAYLRTGDLGCIDDGELFLIGRLKELIVVRGRNVPPQDIETAVAAAHAAIR